MKKLIFLTLAFALIMATAALATNTRVLTMGDNHVILTDDANIWNWPSRLNNYPHLAVGEFGGGDEFTKFGVHWSFGDENPWILATYFEDNGNYFPYWGLPFNPTNSNKRGTFFYAKAMGSNKFGARLSYNQSGFEYTDSAPLNANQEKKTFTYFDASLGLTAADDSWDISLTGGFGTWTDTEGGETMTKPDGLIDFAVLGRMFWGGGTNYSYVPHAGIEYHKGGFEYYTNDTVDFTDKYTNMTVELGIGQIYTPSTNVEAVLDLGVSLERNKWERTEDVVTNNLEEKWNYTTIPYFKLGLDAGVFPWLDARFGATSHWQRYKDEYTQGTFNYDYKESSASNQTYLGLGFHFGNLHVDTYTDPEIFLNGFDFITGVGDDGRTEMNFQISAVYDIM